MTILERFNPQRNSLNFLRLVFALVVVVSHTWPIGGYGPDPSIGGETLGTWAVAGFFAISGYLIANSRLHLPFGAFAVRRVLRIYPAFLVCLVTVAVIFAPLSTLLDHGRVSWRSALSYVGSNSLLKMHQYGISATLSHAPYRRVWDGSLWTLFWEFSCYVVIGVILSAQHRWRRPLTVVIYGLAVVGATVARHHPVNVLAFDFFLLGSFFFAGSLLALYADRVRLDGRMAVAALAVLVVASGIGAWELLGSLAVAYLCLWLGVSLPFAHVGRRNDISYGIYIYAFPVQQLLVAAHLDRLPVGAAVVVSILATLPLAVASWFIVERPALALKARFGQRRSVAVDSGRRAAAPV